MLVTRRLARVVGGLALLTTVTLIAGCSSDDSPDSGLVDPPSSAATAADAASASPVRHLDPAAFATEIGQPGVVLVDVRTPAEYAAGHLANAMNIDMQASDFLDRVRALDRSASYALYCRSDHRSGLAAEQMAAIGFTKVVDLDGGITAWTAAGKPVATG